MAASSIEADRSAKMEAVLSRLDPEERAAVSAALPLVPREVKDQVDALIATTSPDEAVAMLRRYLAVARGGTDGGNGSRLRLRGRTTTHHREVRHDGLAAGPGVGRAAPTRRRASG